MTDDALDRAIDELESASDATTDEAVQERLDDRIEQLQRLAQRGGDREFDGPPGTDDPVVGSVNVDAGDVVDAHVVEANEQLGEFRDSITH